MKRTRTFSIIVVSLFLALLAARTMMKMSGKNQRNEGPNHDMAGKSGNGSLVLFAGNSSLDCESTNQVSNEDFSTPRRVRSSDQGLPDNIKNALFLVADITQRVDKNGERPIQVQETDTQIIIIWPSKHEAENGFHADYEWKAVIDKQSHTVVSRRRGF